MDCKAAHELVPLYFDGELDRTTARELEAHLDDCAECRDALVALDALRRALREDAPRHAAPRELRARVEAELGQHRLRTPRRMPRPWLALAASTALAFLAGGGAVLLWQQQAAPPIAHDLFESHWRALAAASPVDVVSTDRHTVKPWFAGRVDFSPPVIDTSAAGFTLVGGRLDYVGGRAVAAIVYRRRLHVINLFIWPDNGAGAETEARDGYNVRRWHANGMAHSAVSDLNQAELGQFEALIEAGEGR